jgi:hypothetical protein
MSDYAEALMMRTLSGIEIERVEGIRALYRKETVIENNTVRCVRNRRFKC